MRMNIFLKLASVVVAVTFLWTNCIWAEGFNTCYADKLAAQSQTAAVAGTAIPAMEAAGLIRGLAERGIDNMEELVQLGIRKEQIPELDNKWCLISPSSNKEGEEVYYVFEKGKNSYFRLAATEDTTDPIWELLNLLDNEKLSTAGEVIPVTIGEKVYLQSEHRILESQEPAIASFLRIIYGEGAEVDSFRAPQKRDGQAGKKAERGFAETEVMIVLAIAAVVATVVLLIPSGLRISANLVTVLTVVLAVVMAILTGGFITYRRWNEKYLMYKGLKSKSKITVDWAKERLEKLGYTFAYTQEEADRLIKLYLIEISTFDEDGKFVDLEFDGIKHMYRVISIGRTLDYYIIRLGSKKIGEVDDAMGVLKQAGFGFYSGEAEAFAELVVAPKPVCISYFGNKNRFKGHKNIYIGKIPEYNTEFLLRFLGSERAEFVSTAIRKLQELGFSIVYDETTAFTGLANPQPVEVSQFEIGKFINKSPAWIGKAPENKEGYLPILIDALKNPKKEIVDSAVRQLDKLSYAVIADEAMALVDLIDAKPVNVSVFNEAGEKTGEEVMWLGKMVMPEEHLPILIDALKNPKKKIVDSAVRQLDKLSYAVIADEAMALVDLIDAKPVNVSAFNEAGEKTGEEVMWLGKMVMSEGIDHALSHLISKLRDPRRNIVNLAIKRLGEFHLGYGIVPKEEGEKLFGHKKTVIVTKFDEQGNPIGEEEMVFGKDPEKSDKSLPNMLDRLKSTNKKIVDDTRNLLECRWGFDFADKDNKPPELRAPRLVPISQFDNRGNYTGEKEVWIFSSSFPAIPQILIMGLGSRDLSTAVQELQRQGYVFAAEGEEGLVVVERLPQEIDRKTCVCVRMECLVNLLKSRDWRESKKAADILKEDNFVFVESKETAFKELDNPVAVEVGEFDENRTFVRMIQGWLGRRSGKILVLKKERKLISKLPYSLRKESPYTRAIEQKPETEIASTGLGYDGKAGSFEVKGDLTKLAGILGVEKDKAVEKAHEVIQAELDKIRGNPEYGIGIFGSVKEIVLVDNLGGMESVTEGMKGANAELREGRLFIDIDAFRNLQVLKDVVKHELWHSILEKVEGNTAVQEVTAIYQNLLEFAALGETKQSALIEFLRQENNGLDSKEYAELLQHVKDNRIKGDQLIALAISYVSKTARYDYLKNGLKSVLAQDVEDAANKLELAETIYENLIRAVTEWKPAINKVKQAENKSKALMKVKMIAGKADVSGADLVDSLNEKGKFVKIYVEDLEQDAYITEWLGKILEGKEKSPFLICSRDEDPAKAQEKVAEFLRNKNIKQADVPEGIRAIDIIDARDIGYAFGRELPQGCLSLPLIRSVSGIYLAGQVVLVDGDLEQLRAKDPLAYNSLLAMYSALFGDTFTVEMLKQIIFGIWPAALNIIEDLEHLRTAIKETEKAA